MNKPTLRTFELFDKECIRFVKKFRSAERFVKAFRDQYDFIVAYHGTNINDTDALDILQEGLKCATTALLKKRAEDRFVIATDTQQRQDQIKELIAGQFIAEEFIAVGEINFTLEKEPLQGQAYQYLLFGPESLMPVADNLRRLLKQNFRKIMMEYGNPTIIKARLPVSKTSDYWLQAICGYWKGDGSECCLVYREDLPSEHIIELEKVPRPSDLYGFLWI